MLRGLQGLVGLDFVRAQRGSAQFRGPRTVERAGRLCLGAGRSSCRALDRSARVLSGRALSVPWLRRPVDPRRFEPLGESLALLEVGLVALVIGGLLGET